MEAIKRNTAFFDAGRHIPIAVLLGFVIQGAVWLWWMASFVATTATRLSSVEHRLDVVENIPARIAALEAQVSIANQVLVELRDRAYDGQRCKKEVSK